MENKENIYYRMPFYMTYPMQNLYITEMEYEKDMERMKALYPSEVRELQKMVELRCNEMEYEGSRMYDENPDRYMIEEEVLQLMEAYSRDNPHGGHDHKWLRSLIGILFHDEMYRRRCRHRRCNRWW